MLGQLIPQALRRFAGGLRFPQLFALVSVLFVLDFFVPDAIPFFDEMFLGLLTLMFGSWKEHSADKGQAATTERPPVKDVTPPDAPNS